MENKFLNGLLVKQKHANAPEWIVCTLSIKREELIATLQGMEGDWINADVKIAKNTGKYYAQINDFKKKEVTEEEVNNLDSLEF